MGWTSGPGVPATEALQVIYLFTRKDKTKKAATWSAPSLPAAKQCFRIRHMCFVPGVMPCGGRLEVWLGELGG